MMFRNLTRLAAFRLALLFAALFVCAIAVVLAVLYSSIADDLTERQKTRIDGLRATLIDVGKTGSFDDLKRMVSNYAAEAEPEDDVVLLTDEANAYIAGNVKSVSRFAGWRTIPKEQLAKIGDWSSKSSSTAVIGRWTEVKGGHVFVAGGNGDINEVKDILLDTLGLGALLSAFCALAGGVILGVGTQHRLRSMEMALDSVTRGDLNARLPRHGSQDDLDHIAAMVNRTLDHLQSVVRTLKQVTSDIAHDLKSPIGRALQKLDSLREADLPAPLAEKVTAASTDLKGSVDTFEALLRIAEIEGGARKARFSQLDLKPLLVNVVDILDVVASDAGQVLVADWDKAASCRVLGDRELLTQAFINLIENAIRHCPTGSRIEVGLLHKDDAAVITVADNGPGIPIEECERVFERHYRLEKSRTTPGTGLGLSLVAAIADLHDARIALSDNKPGLIASITFHLI